MSDGKPNAGVCVNDGSFSENEKMRLRSSNEEMNFSMLSMSVCSRPESSPYASAVTAYDGIE